MEYGILFFLGFPYQDMMDLLKDLNEILDVQKPLGEIDFYNFNNIYYIK